MPHQQLNLLLLGGTGEARAAAKVLRQAGHRVISSLAGVTENPRLPEGETRIGGFGGVAGMVDYIKSQNIDIIIDSTHPFAVNISIHAVLAAREAAIPCLRLERPEWLPEKGDDWRLVPDIKASAALIEAQGKVFLSIGHKGLDIFAKRRNLEVTARMIDPPQQALPAHWHIITQRPPFTFEDEYNLLKKNNITVLVSKNAGGRGRQKLDAARALKIPVVMIERPEKPAVATAASPAQLLELLKQRNDPGMQVE